MTSDFLDFISPNIQLETRKTTIILEYSFNQVMCIESFESLLFVLGSQVVRKKILRSQQEFSQCSTLLLPEKIPLLCIVSCVSCQTVVLLRVQSLHIISSPSSSWAVHPLDHESAPKCFLCCVFPLISLQFSAALPGPSWANTSSMVIYLCMLRNYKQKHKICPSFI